MSTGQITQSTVQILARLCQTAAQAVGGLAAEVAVWDDAEKQLIIHAFSGPPPPARGWAIGDGALGRAWREPKPMLASSLADLEPDALSFATAAGADAVFILPITNPTRVMGLLLVFRRGNPGLVWDDIDLLDLFAQQAANALENGELAARQQSLADSLAAANRELEAEVARRQAAEAALCQVQERFAILFRNSPAGIALARLDDGILLDANAIQRASLFEQTERRLQRLAALRAIDMAISSSLDLHITLDLLLDQAISQLRVDAASVLLLSPHSHSLDYAAGRGFRSRAVERSSLRLGEGFSGQAALERRTVAVPNLAQAQPGASLPAVLSGEGFRAYYGVPLMAKGLVHGVLEVFQRSPLQPDLDWLEFLETLAGQAAIAVDNTQLFNGLQRSNLDLALAYESTIEGWSRALDLRDRETEGHTQRVTELTLQLARASQIDEKELLNIRRGALLHDIGKMGIPDSILLKPGALTPDEWVIMRQHPTVAYQLLSPIAYLRLALDIPYCHHEKWDGSGYPRGLNGDQIPLSARLFAMADVWDALRSDRPYRASWPAEQVRQHIHSLAGTHFDPAIVEAFLEMVSDESTQLV